MKEKNNLGYPFFNNEYRQNRQKRYALVEFSRYSFKK